MYNIKDWAGNILNYKGRIERPEFAVPMSFKTFDEAWEYIFENFDEDDFDEYSVFIP